ncbi:hypothetical protein BS78_09G209600 [Paspalum vaginatum]|nr:hypothetical protein BS78_09G209600 [Paspalum vaginatum]
MSGDDRSHPALGPPLVTGPPPNSTKSLTQSSSPAADAAPRNPDLLCDGSFLVVPTADWVCQGDHGAPAAEPTPAVTVAPVSTSPSLSPAAAPFFSGAAASLGVAIVSPLRLSSSSGAPPSLPSVTTPAPASTPTLNPLAPFFSSEGPSSSRWLDNLELSGSAFSLSEDEESDDGYVSPSFLDEQGKDKARMPTVVGRGSSPPRSGFMADARRLRSVVVPSAHVALAYAGEEEEEGVDGWTTVVHRHRRRSMTRPVECRHGRETQPVPLELEGWIRGGFSL